MSDYQEFRRRSIKRRMWKRIYRTALVIAVLAVLVAGGWFAAGRLGLLRPDAPQSSQSQPAGEPEPTPEQTPPPQDELAAAHTTDADWNRLDYPVRTLNTAVQPQIDDGSTAMDYRLAGRSGESGTVELSYFDGVTFVGDSLTQGLQIYDTGLPNAHYCAYRGAGPQAFVTGAECTRVDGQKEIAMDALVASAPNQVYILLGTNVLVRDGSYEGFLGYYGQMLDMIRTALPATTIYVQSITPVRPEVRQEKPGLYNERLQRINDELAALALQKGCYFIDLWEALADENGDLRADIAQPDGYHIKPEGYTLWIEYLRSHTAYTPGVPYVAGTSYYIEQ